MTTRRIDLVAGIPVNLTNLLTPGAFYHAQYRGQTGALYIAELASVNPTANDVSGDGFVYGVGDTFPLRPSTFEIIWAVAPNGGRLTVGDA